MKSKRILLGLVVGLSLIAVSGYCATEQQARAQFEKGATYEAQGNHTAAIAEWRIVLRDFLDQPRECANAQLSIGLAYEALDMGPEARDELQKVIGVYPQFRAEASEAQLKIGESYQRCKLYDNAIVAFERVTENYSDRPIRCATARTYAALCRTNLDVENLDETVAELDKVANDFKTNPEARRVCAQATKYAGQVLTAHARGAEAIPKLQGILTVYPDFPDICVEALMQIGKAQRKLEQVDKALVTYQKVVDSYPAYTDKGAVALLARADIYAEKRDYDKSIADFKNVMKYYGKQPTLAAYCRDAQFGLACSLRFAGRREEALAEYAKVIADSSFSAEMTVGAHEYRGQIYVDQKKPDEALLEFQNAIDANRQDSWGVATIKFLIAGCYTTKSDNEHARQLEQELDADTTVQSSPHLLFDLAMLQYALHGKDAALPTFRKYAEMGGAKWRGARGEFTYVELMYHFERDWAKAAELAEMFLEKFPGDRSLCAEAEFIKAGILEKNGDKNGAIAAYQALVSTYQADTGRALDWVGYARDCIARLQKQ